jgi:PST family polysaccharide transporter
MIYVLGGATMIRALAITHQSLLEKNLDFKQSALVTTLPTIPATLLTIFLAARGYGAWSIIWGQMVSVALEVIAVWAVVPWRPSWSFDLRSARAVIEYGKHVFGAQLAYYGITNVDYALVGRLLGTNLVGQYSFGYEKALMPFKYVVSPVADVFYPALNRVREDPVALRDGYLKIARLVGAVTLPLTMGMILLAPELVQVVFDPKWLPSVPVLQLTAVWTMALTFCVNAASVAYALGRPDLRLRYHTLELALLIPAILLAAREGIVAVGLVVMLAHLVGGLLLMNAVHRLIPVSGWTVFKAIWPSLSSTALMAGAILAGRTVAEGLLSPGLFLVAATGGGAVLYTASLLGLHPEMRGLMRVVWQHLRSQRGDEG